jgi:hypothetical protein
MEQGILHKQLSFIVERAAGTWSKEEEIGIHFLVY